MSYAIAALVCAAGAAFAWAKMRLMVVTVIGGSMQPALSPDDRVLAVRGKPVRHGIVVLRAPEHATGFAARPLRVKRLIALPGEPMPEAIRAVRGSRDGEIVPPGHVVVLGDHPKSEDSKQWGPIPIGSVVATVRRTMSRA